MRLLHINYVIRVIREDCCYYDDGNNDAVDDDYVDINDSVVDAASSVCVCVCVCVMLIY